MSRCYYRLLYSAAQKMMSEFSWQDPSKFALSVLTISQAMLAAVPFVLLRLFFDFNVKVGLLVVLPVYFVLLNKNEKTYERTNAVLAKRYRIP